MQRTVPPRQAKAVEVALAPCRHQHFNDLPPIFSVVEKIAVEGEYRTLAIEFRPKNEAGISQRHGHVAIAAPHGQQGAVVVGHGHADGQKTFANHLYQGHASTGQTAREVAGLG